MPPETTPPPYQQHPPYQIPPHDPGQTYAVIGIIMLVVFLPIIGLILSLIGYSKSKKAGIHSTLAQVGIWLNAVFTVILAFGIGALIIWGVSEDKRQLEQADKASDVVQEIKSFTQKYAAENAGAYPEYSTLVEEYAGGDQALANETRLVESSNPAAGEVGYEACATSGSVDGFRLYYADNRADNYDISDSNYYKNKSETVGTCDSSAR